MARASATTTDLANGLGRGRVLLQLVGQRVNLEAIETRNELALRQARSQLRVDHKQHVRKAGAKVGAIGVMKARRLWIVDVHALWAVQLHHILAGHVGQTDRQHWLIIAIMARAIAKVAILILFDHLGDATIR